MKTLLISTTPQENNTPRTPDPLPSPILINASEPFIDANSQNRLTPPAPLHPSPLPRPPPLPQVPPTTYRKSPPTTRKTQNVEAQVHHPPSSPTARPKEESTTEQLQTIFLSKSTTRSNSHISTITNDHILPLSPADGTSSQTNQESKQFPVTKEMGKNMMNGPIKVNMTETAYSEPSLKQNHVTGTLSPTLPTSLINTHSHQTQAPHTSSTTTLPPPIAQKPTYHLARPNRKLQDWFFKPRKPVLILGDSNISRIPTFNNPNMQLDSYPGANLYHFLKICEKTITNPSVKIVVFSIGLNNRDQDARQTSIKQLKALAKQAHSTFPNADIYFPIINYSTNLTLKQQANLKLINNTIATFFSFLAEIPHDSFQTEPDNIHWTPITATTIFNYWCKQLNL